MTAPIATTTRPAAPSRGARPDSLPFGGIVASEATKFRSVRSTWWTLLCVSGTMIGFGVLFCFAYVSRFDRLDLRERLQFDPTLHSLRGLFLAQLAIGVLGVLMVTNEYATGMIRNTFAAVPQRSAVLAAKLVVFSAVALVVATLTSFVAFLVGQSILSQKHVQASLGDPGVLRAVIGAGLYLVGIGVLGIGLGVLLRRTAGAIATLVGLVIVFPILSQALPSPWNTDVAKVLPDGAGQAIMQVRHTSESLSPWVGFALFCAYIAVILGLAFFSLARRDA